MSEPTFDRNDTEPEQERTAAAGAGSENGKEQEFPLEVTSLPSSEPASSAASSHSGGRPGPLSCQSRLLAQVEQIGSILQRLNVLFSSPTTTDRVLCTGAYALRLITSFLSAVLAHRRRSGTLPAPATVVRTKVEASSIPAGDESVVVIRVEETERVGLAADRVGLDVRLGDWISRLSQLEGLVSDYRVFVRLWGLVGLSQWAVGHWQSGIELSKAKRDGRVSPSSSVALSDADLAGLTPLSDPFSRRLVWTQIGANMVYQLLENGAYLSQHGVLRWSKEQQERMWLWSARFWATHVGLELVRLWREASLARERKAWRVRRAHDEVLAEKGGSGGRAAETQVEMDAAAAWYRSLVTNFAYAPLTLHWSVPEGLLGNVWVGLLGSVAGGVGLVDAWRRSGGR